MNAMTAEMRAPTQAPAQGGSPAVVMEGIVKQLAIAGTYNLEEVTLAPHVLYTRHGHLHVDGVTLERGGRPPKEPKIVTFRLSGLTGLRVTPRRFEPSALFHAGEERYAGTVLLAIDRG